MALPLMPRSQNGATKQALLTFASANRTSIVKGEVGALKEGAEQFVFAACVEQGGCDTIAKVFE